MTRVGEFRKEVVKAAKRLGWRHCHAHEPRRDKNGFPDLVMVRSGRIVFAKLKRDAKAVRDEVTTEQDEWLFALHAVQRSVESHGCRSVQVFLWCPDDWDEVLKVLN